MPVLQQTIASVSDENDRHSLCSELRMVVGAIITLAVPPSKIAFTFTKCRVIVMISDQLLEVDIMAP